jgi:hypothetical protein
MIGQPVPMQVADEPADPRRLLHPAKELHQQVVVQVMGELRTDDQVDTAGGPIIEHVGRHPADRPTGLGGLLSRRRRPWVEVDAGQIDRDSVFYRPIVDFAEHPAIATAGVQNDQRPVFRHQSVSHQPVQECHHRPVGQGPEIDAFKIDQAVAEFREAGDLDIHQLRRG